MMLVVAGVLLAGVATASASRPNPEHQVTLCHRTDSNTRPYVQITVDVASVRKEHGHDGHDGPVWNDTLKARHIKWGDIIPAFDYDGQHYPGKNLTPDGLAILHGGCRVPSGESTTPSSTCPPTSSSTTVSSPPASTPAPTTSAPGKSSFHSSSTPSSTTTRRTVTVVRTGRTRVVPAPSTSLTTPVTPGLARTGSDALSAAVLSVIAVACGTALLYRSRRRWRRTH
jgi:hypothetical protein